MMCRSCYRDMPPGASFCPHCGARVAGPVPPPVPAPVAAAAGSGADEPWERAGRGPVAAFAETLQQVLFHPTSFFRGTAPDRGAGAALLYSVIVGTLSIGTAFLWQRVLGERVSWDVGGRYFDLLDHRPALAGLSVFLPIGSPRHIVWAAVLHVLARALGRLGTYATTLKAVLSPSATAFNVFPVCGRLLAPSAAVVQVIGLRELHRTSRRARSGPGSPFLVAIRLAANPSARCSAWQVWQQFGGGRSEV
jgi:hypothetical protein